MYYVKLYATEAGNEPVTRFLEHLAKEHKTRQMAQIHSIIDLLKKHGLEINQFMNQAMKCLEDGIYELRTSHCRVLFAYDQPDTFILLLAFEKKTQKTPRKMIEIAKKERNLYLKHHEKREKL